MLTSFKAEKTNFVGSKKSSDYTSIVAKMWENFSKLGMLNEFKLHFLDSHLDRYLDNIGDYSEEQGERFHQDMKVMEQCYQDRWDENVMANFCWMLKTEQTGEGQNVSEALCIDVLKRNEQGYTSKKLE